MKNNIQRKLMLIVVLLTSLHAFAHDFEVDGIYYNILSETDKAVEVTCRGAYASTYDNEYSDTVKIPLEVKYNEVKYTVTSIGEDAFSLCGTLTAITIPNSVTSIGVYAFYGCHELTSITIPNSVKSIGSSAFTYCSSLTSIIIPNSVTSIGNGAFSNCSSLTSIIIPNSVKSIGSSAFYGCSSLTSVTIPNSITSNIGNLTFANCTNLTSITIPDSVVNIGEYVFQDCLKLSTIILGKSVKSIGKRSFDRCGVTEIYFKSTIPPTHSASFSSDQYRLTTLYVPKGFRDIYVSTSPWSKFSKIQEKEWEGSIVTSITLDKTGLKMKVTETTTLSAIVLPETATIKDVVWSSTDATVASVKDGVVTAHKIGEAIIIATTTDGSNLSATCKVKVVATPAESVVISKPEKTTLIVGDEVQLTATVYPETATDKTVEWLSNNEKVAMVDTTGKVTAIGAGNAIITARNSNGDTDSVEFSVVPILIESLKLDKTAISAIVGDEIILTANIYPLNATNTELKWSIDDKNIASLVSNGNEATITILKEGTTKVFVETTDGSNLIAKCEINALSSVTEILNDEVNISVENGNVVIGGVEDAKVEILNINGQCVYRGNATTIPVIAKGLYIVKVNGKSYKVIL